MGFVFDANYDVVVIGGGGSGLSAAVQAAKNGNSCAIIEKEAQLGGSTSFAEGIGAWESDEQAKRGIKSSKKEAFDRYMDHARWRLKAPIVSRFVDNAAKTIAKIREEGVNFTDVTVAIPDNNELTCWHMPEGEGAKVVEILSGSAKRLGVDIFLSTAAKELLKDGDRVVGVRTIDSDKNEVLIGAKAVIVASGGFANNPEMLDRYGRFKIGAHAMNVGGPGNTGDGVNMVLAAGGQTTQNIGTRLYFPLLRDKSVVSDTNAAGFQPYLWVDGKGRRFVNEARMFNYADAGNVVAAQPGHFYWAVLGSEVIEHLQNSGNEVGFGLFVHNFVKHDGLKTEIDADAADSSRTNVFSANSIEELAQKMGVCSDNLVREVGEYNAACDAGEDKKFYKNAKFLKPVKRAPFYAIKMETGVVITMGALDVDEKLRALNGDGDPIKGLYVVGCDAAGPVSEFYPLLVPGTACSFALTSGWLAADDASERIKSGELA